jgi:hypothetical protein
MKHNPYAILSGTVILVFAMLGCGDDVPRQHMPTDGSNPHVSGSPQDRIASIQEDSTLAAEEKERRIAIIKQRNQLK